eukprot:1161613-Pelagomonas_calceolata.AAC.4
MPSRFSCFEESLFQGQLELVALNRASGLWMKIGIRLPCTTLSKGLDAPVTISATIASLRQPSNLARSSRPLNLGEPLSPFT